CMQARQTPHSF
nr:immunoglobulin light chain junction region [Macaca mulatta]